MMSGQNSLLSQFLLASQVSLGIVFFLSVIPKLRSPLTFSRNVAEYKILPSVAAYGLALVLIPLEAFLAIAFLGGWWINAALPLAAAVFVLFLIAVSINLRRERRISCGCFGQTSEQISIRTLARLLLLLVLVLLLVVLKEAAGISPRPLNQIIHTGVTFSYLTQTVFLAIFLILAASWLLNLQELASIARHGFSEQFSTSHTTVEDELENT